MAADLSTNVISHWRAETTTGTDEVGSNTLTNTNSVTNAAGKQGNAWSFASGSLQYMSIADNASVSAGAGSLGLHCWVQFATLANMGIAGQFGPAGSYAYLLYLDHGASPADRLHFYVSADGTALVEVGALTFGAVTTGVLYDVNAWFDVTAHTINIQINNGTVDSAAFTGPIFDSTAPFYVGRWSSGEYMNGRVDEITLLKSASGPPWTAEQRAWITNGGAGQAWPWAPVGSPAMNDLVIPDQTLIRPRFALATH